MFVFMHISDLHIGSKPAWFGSFGARSATRTPALLPSQHGHDERVADDLRREWQRLRLAHPQARILATGDLTRVGAGNDFGCAHRFLHSYWSFPTVRWEVGCRTSADDLLTVPGNHDFWYGNFAVSFLLRTAVIDGHFWPLPWVRALRDPATPDLEVHVIGLNSCSGLGSVSLSQALATGAVDVAELRAAAQCLADEHARAAQRGARAALRVVMLHHPPAALSRKARRDLVTWMSSNQVEILLAGHTHVPSPPQARPAALVCGTTLQCGTPTHLPGAKPNHYYLHTVAWRNGQAQWTTYESWHYGAAWTPIDPQRGPVFQDRFAAVPV